MPIIKITPAIDLRHCVSFHSKIVIVRPLSVPAPNLSPFVTREPFYAELPEGEPPEGGHQCRQWFDGCLRKAERAADGERLIVLPEVWDFASAQFAYCGWDIACSIVTVISYSVTEAIRGLWSHGVDQLQLEDARILDLTGRPVTLTVDVPDRMPLQLPIHAFAEPKRLSLGQYVESTRHTFAERWTGDVRDTAFTGIEGFHQFAARLRNGYAQIEAADEVYMQNASSATAEIPPNAPGFNLVTKHGLLEVWVAASAGSGYYTAAFCDAAKRVHGFDFRAENQSRYDLDHACARTVAIRSSRAEYVLLTPIEKRVNRSWGYVERCISHDRMGGPAMRQADWLTMAKLLGIPAPSLSRDGTVLAGIERISDALERAGAIHSWQRQDAMSGLKDLYQSVWRGRDIAGNRAGPLLYPDDRFRETRSVRRKAHSHQSDPQSELG